jgi:hypothetical protein
VNLKLVVLESCLDEISNELAKYLDIVIVNDKLASYGQIL